MMIKNTTKLSKTAMNEGGMMTNFKSGAWCVARSAVIMSLIMIGLTATAGAAVFAQYTFPTNQGPPAGNINPTISGTGLTVSPITNGATNTYEVSSNGYGSSPELRVGPQSTTLPGAVTANSYVQFTLTPDGGNQLNLTNLTLNAARGGGETPRGWGLRSSLDGYASNISGPNDIPTQRPTWTGYNIDLSGAQFQGLTAAITFRVYFYSPATGSTVEMDDITVNGTVTTTGGATCSDSIQNQGETGVDCGGPCAPCGATTVLNQCEMDGDFCTYWTPSDNGTNTPWTFDADITTSNNVGPSGPYSGSQYVYTEASTPSAGDEWYLESQTLDAATYDITLDFWYNKHHNGTSTCDLAVEVSTDGGTTWPATAWSTSVDDGVGNANGTNWRNQQVDLSAYSGNLLVRFRAASGGNWQCDTALDLVELTGVTAGTGGGGSGGPPAVNPAGTYIEAENYTTMSAPNPWAWEEQSLVPGFSGTGYLYTTNGGTGANPQGARADYPLDFGGGGRYCIWIRGMDQSGNGGGDSVFWGVDGGYVGAITQTADNVWAWDSDTQNGSNCFTISAGIHTLNLWPREAGQKTDAILISTVDANADPSAGGLLTGDDDRTTVIPPGATVVDPTDTGAVGANYLIIPESQVVNGAAVNLRKVDLTADPAEVIGADELIFDTDQTVTYRALGEETDGFDDFSVQPKWQHANVGNDVPGAPVMEQTNGTFKLKGSGQDIWNTADYFSYHFQGNKSGDFTVDVEVKSLVDSAGGGINQWAKTGIMVRQSLANNSRHAMMVVTPGNGARFQYRPTDGANSQNPTAGNGTTAPTWLRLKRVGNTFTGYYSSDGISWTESNPGGTTVNMTDPVNVGLAVTSHDTNRDSIATFDNFLFMPAATSGMSETWATANTVAPWTAIDTTDWTDGTFGISMRGGSNIETKLYDYSKCTDASVSSITIAAGQTISGSAASLSGLFSTTGNVGSFQYMIDGATVSNPWNSFAAQADGTIGDHTLTVSGTDPDCGGRQISASETVSVDNTCTDASPSTVTILTGQAVGGPSVDLTALHSNSGNVGTFTYKINGIVVATPAAWDSSAYGGATSENVNFEVSGIDPDCGGRTVTALNTIAVDNTCVRNEPSISFNEEIGYVGAGRAIPYQVTIRNEDSFNCSASTFDVNITADPVNSDFVASYFNPSTANQNILLNGRESATIELAVEATPGAVEWNQKDVTVTINSQEDPNGAHNDGATPGPTTGTVTTKVFLSSPITHNSVTTGSTKWGGNWGTSETGSKYGNFDCMTCHSKTGSEIKWMRNTITTPDGSNWGISSSPEVTIQFKDARSSKEIVAEGGDPVTDVYWGHDDPAGDGSGHATSDRVCEVCHSVTQHHRADTNSDPDGAGPLGPQTIVQGETHFPSRDCTDCHRHELGFTADCTGCHGDPPLEATLGGPNGLADIPAATGSVTPGTHYKHTVVLGFACEYCHNGWRTVGEMPKEIAGKQDINHMFNTFYDLSISDPRRNNGHYTGQDGVSYEGTVIPAGQGTMTCENIYCHGGADDPDQPGSNMGGTNPTWNGNITCNGCHGTSATDTPPGYSHTTHVGEMKLACTDCHFTNGQQAGYNGHVNGRVNIQLNPALPSKGGAPMYDPTPGDGGVGALATYNSNTDGTDLPPSNNYGSCLNIACHYGNETPVWNNGGQAAQCNDCHNDGAPDDSSVQLQLRTAAPNTGNHEQHVHPAAGTIDERMISTFVSGCESCHGGGANTGNHSGHVNQAVDFGGGMSYSLPSGNGGTCTSQCHANISESGGTIVWGSGEFLDCAACHEAPYIGPTVVDPAGAGAGMAASGYGSHMKATNGDIIDGSTNWTTQCRKCHPYHEGGFEITQPASSWNQLGDGTDMAYKLGLQFPVTGGIHLGGTVATEAAEAEMCWGCHDNNGISEWGANNNAMTGSMAYDYGSVTSSNWTSAVWTSGYAGFAYKTAAIQSTHAANQAILAVDSANGIDEVSRSGVDDVSAIRCTYCHDVHDRNKALVDHNAGTYEVLTGAPYLRGAWTGNPFKEDGAPQSGTTYNNYTAENYGRVPRASSNTAQLMGGYWIDQNSGNPVSGNYDSFGGLCQMCHGTDINSLNQYGAQGAGWVSGLNGHANSVKGGAGGGGQAARNIYTAGDRGGGSTNSYNGHMGYWGFREPGDGGGGIRGGDGDSFNITPGVDGYGNEPCANDGGSCNGTYESDWDNLRTFDVDGSNLDNNYHTFSCAKCHNPHASRLPKLMITNCLDTKQNQWDNNIQMGTGGPTILDNVTAAAWTTAQNCHRLAGKDDPMDGNDVNTNSSGSGWNLVTPWTDGDANYNTHPDKTQDNTGTW